jgi:hypothetical protein
MHWLDPSAAGIPLDVGGLSRERYSQGSLILLTAEQRKNHVYDVEEARRGVIQAFASQQLLPRVARDRLPQEKAATSQGRRLHT